MGETKEESVEKKPAPPPPRLASPELLEEARAIEKNLTWADLVRIAQKPKRSGWILWKASGAIEQVTPLPKPDRLLVRGWKSASRHIIVRHADDEEYKCVEIDAVTKRPIKAHAT
jgi:hypothetical protein